MDFGVVAVCDGESRRIGWIGLQPDGAISIGLNDKTFISPDFKARKSIWNAYNRVTLNYVIASSPVSLKSIRNPHLTFHPPVRFHLKANGSKTLFEGIADLAIMLEQDGVVPWVRFVSRPVASLSSAGVPRKPDRTETLSIHPVSDNCSLGLGVDFVRSNLRSTVESTLLSEFIPWQGYQLHVHSVSLRPQIATLAWFHHY